ncbi:MAG: TetR/AcrR family transcriptional regulator [Porticoccaceae bacterium]|jgi:AcrR family transcriptional regulator|nr:TetR/AcrR family transcriptional regulator [Porticoccaceae bacterium]MBT7904136.1 TetR/AcrR family transcriptional regulator [Porticoccaceae bacterium]MDA7853650.1 TetR/AcrR family transcriptional regulator [Porticoccaceae bacterium]MDA8919901.1 TetR/AcrR family transcriptional regulator [Porticoccaceae bacterium]MDA9566044.1 TetR/AcrR family transcriptional regulator [Porticoccaceae bacterium]
MSSPTLARGNITRQANKKLRRQRILDIAKHLIASQGFEAFTLSHLAKEAGVSTPTIHNLFGKKDNIFQELVSQMVNTISLALSNPDVSDPIEGAEVFTDNLLRLYKQDEAFYRSAFMAADRTGLFDHKLPDGIFHQSLQIAERLCTEAKENGFLKGNIATGTLAEQLFACQRLARQDWVNGYIDLQRYRKQVLIGMYITYAADASPDFYKMLCNKINQLVDS